MRLPADENTTLSARVQPKGRPSAVLGGGQIQLKGNAVLDLESQTRQGIPMVTGLEVGQPQPADPARPSIILRRAGDGGLWHIAKQTGSTMEAIRQANGLQGDPAQGQMLLIPIG